MFTFSHFGFCKQYERPNVNTIYGNGPIIFYGVFGLGLSLMRNEKVFLRNAEDELNSRIGQRKSIQIFKIASVRMDKVPIYYYESNFLTFTLGFV
jgi:hypothetical protein